MLRTVKGKYMLSCEQKKVSQLMQMSMRKLRYVSQASKEKEARNLTPNLVKKKRHAIWGTPPNLVKMASNLRYVSQANKEKEARNLTPNLVKKKRHAIWGTPPNLVKMASNLRYVSQANKAKEARRDKEKAARRVRSHSTLNIGC